MTDLNKELMEALASESKVSVDEVTALLEVGANPNATNEDGGTALYKAAFSNDNYFEPRHEWLKICQGATNENPEVFIALIEAGADAKAFFREYDPPLLGPSLLRANREIMLAVVKQAGRLLEDADDSLKSDQEIVLAAIGDNPHAYEFASDTLKSDPEFVAAAMEVDQTVRDYVNKEPPGEMHDFEVTWEVYYWDEEVGYTTTESFESESLDSLLEELEEGRNELIYCPEEDVPYHEGDFNIECVLIHDSKGNEIYRGEGEMDPKDW